MPDNENEIFATEQERLNHTRKVGKVFLDAQMHFNDLLMRAKRDRGVHLYVLCFS